MEEVQWIYLALHAKHLVLLAITYPGHVREKHSQIPFHVDLVQCVQLERCRRPDVTVQLDPMSYRAEKLALHSRPLCNL